MTNDDELNFVLKVMVDIQIDLFKLNYRKEEEEGKESCIGFNQQLIGEKQQFPNENGIFLKRCWMLIDYWLLIIDDWWFHIFVQVNL